MLIEKKDKRPTLYLINEFGVFFDSCSQLFNSI